MILHVFDKFDPEEKGIMLFVTKLSVPESITEAESLIYRKRWS